MPQSGTYKIIPPSGGIILYVPFNAAEGMASVHGIRLTQRPNNTVLSPQRVADTHPKIKL